MVTEPVRSTIQQRDAKGVVRHGGEWLLLWSDPDSLKSTAELAADRALAQRRTEQERDLASALRAVAHRPALKVRFTGDTVGVSAAEVVLPALPEALDPGTLAVARGQADAAAARLRWHDPDLQERLAPIGPRAHALFDALGQSRAEALAVRGLPGILANLRAAALARMQYLGLTYAVLASQVPVVEAMRQLSLDVLTGEPGCSLPIGGLEMWSRWARVRLGDELASLAAHVDDQARYAASALVLIAALARQMDWERDEIAQAPNRPGEPGARGEVGEGDAAGTFRLGGEDQAGTSEQPLPAGPSPLSRPIAPAAEAAAAYAAYTTAYDRVATPEELASPTELGRLRHELDTELGDRRALLARLAHRLQRQLLALQRSSWLFDLEEGMLDAARLDRVVVNPGAALSFKQESDSPFRDTVVALLIDNSGSMRGDPIRLAAMAADITAQALGRCGVRCEVLGFTTAAWQGGRAARDWEQAGRPPHPGRIGELLHLVYKPADQPYNRARIGLALMLREQLLKENVDGEALLWACGRLTARPEARKLLLVVSDGAPSDRATLRANDDDRLLDAHLRQVIRDIEASGVIELAAIGIGHDVTGHYARAITLPDANALAPILLHQLGELLAPPPRRRGPPGQTRLRSIPATAS